MSSRRLYVGGLLETTTTQHLRDLFAPFGTVEGVHIVLHKFTGKMAGYGFVEMDSEEHAIRAATALEGTQRDGMRLRTYVTPFAHQKST
ncbi:MAG: RNA-binding protein [Nitrospiraceae bacterium]|jgi:RNA recognition motif-containing protein